MKKKNLINRDQPQSQAISVSLIKFTRVAVSYALYPFQLTIHSTSSLSLVSSLPPPPTPSFPSKRFHKKPEPEQSSLEPLDISFVGHIQ